MFVNRTVVEELRILFTDLGQTGSVYVKPREELAYLALVSSKDEDEDEDEDLKVQELLGDAAVAATSEMSDMTQISSKSQKQDTAVNVTAFSAKEVSDEFAPTHKISTPTKVNTMDDDTSSDANLAESPPPFESYSATKVDRGDIESSMPTSSRALPPRRQSTIKYGKQQDVTECSSNVLFQIEAAIRPTGVDANGEQLDIVKEYDLPQLKSW